MVPNDDDPLIADENELAEDSLPAVPEKAVPIELTQLFPWHRPRKQKVRQDQWVRLAGALIDHLTEQAQLQVRNIVLPDGTNHPAPPEFRYLCLPGIDYLDGRLIGQKCNEKNCKLVLVGFLSEAENKEVLARAQLRQSALIQARYLHDTSTTIPRRFESICQVGSHSLSELKRRAPFHVVNIDACGSIAPVRADHAQRLIDAIFKIVELQLSKASHRWLLFLTADVRSGDFDAATFDAICDAIRANAAANNDFGAQTIDFLKPDAATAEDAIIDAKANDGRPFLNLFMLGFVKWLLHLAQQKQWSVKLKKSHCYSTREEGDHQPSMCSLAVEFNPPPPGLRDPHNATRQAPAAGGNVDDPSMQIIAETKLIDNLDDLLKGDSPLTGTLNKATHGLLKEIGYKDEVVSPLIAPLVDGQDPPPHRFPDLV